MRGDSGTLRNESEGKGPEIKSGMQISQGKKEKRESSVQVLRLLTHQQ